MKYHLQILILAVSFFGFHCFSSDMKVPTKPDTPLKPILIPPQYLKPIIGRVEWIYFPNWKIKLRARIDTGAKSSSIHAVNVERVVENGETFVYFDTYQADEKPIRLKAKFVKEAKVTSSNGQSETRILISESMRLGKITEDVLISLNDRSSLTYPVLIGRNFLMGKFLVDVSLSHALGD